MHLYMSILSILKTIATLFTDAFGVIVFLWLFNVDYATLWYLMTGILSFYKDEMTSVSQNQFVIISAKSSIWTQNLLLTW